MTKEINGIYNRWSIVLEEMSLLNKLNNVKYFVYNELNNKRGVV